MDVPECPYVCACAYSVFVFVCTSRARTKVSLVQNGMLFALSSAQIYLLQYVGVETNTSTATISCIIHYVCLPINGTL